MKHKNKCTNCFIVLHLMLRGLVHAYTQLNSHVVFNIIFTWPSPYSWLNAHVVLLNLISCYVLSECVLIRSWVHLLCCYFRCYVHVTVCFFNFKKCLVTNLEGLINNAKFARLLYAQYRSSMVGAKLGRVVLCRIL